MWISVKGLTEGSDWMECQDIKNKCSCCHSLNPAKLCLQAVHGYACTISSFLGQFYMQLGHHLPISVAPNITNFYIWTLFTFLGHFVSLVNIFFLNHQLIFSKNDEWEPYHKQKVENHHLLDAFICPLWWPIYINLNNHLCRRRNSNFNVLISTWKKSLPHEINSSPEDQFSIYPDSAFTFLADMYLWRRLNKIPCMYLYLHVPNTFTRENAKRAEQLFQGRNSNVH